MIEIEQTALEGVVTITPRKFGDSRGFFSETYNAARLAERGISIAFCQDNHSFSRPPGVLRGLHYQLHPRAQDKLVRVIRGAIFDVAVDIRKGSPTFGRWVGVTLSADNWTQLLVPKGFAHGFVTLRPETEVLYKVSDFHSPEHERSIRFDDPAIGIDWPGEPAGFTLSEKDRDAPMLADADNTFTHQQG